MYRWCCLASGTARAYVLEHVEQKQDHGNHLEEVRGKATEDVVEVRRDDAKETLYQKWQIREQGSENDAQDNKEPIHDDLLVVNGVRYCYTTLLSICQ